ncbi:unnamed protein product [Cylindrotheca closterium]|uniref:PH domain-containing protein n=1 Tax=Cylindrotheca closterium TaxID=2856 RepID=A0AAD2PX71_9STRA|nr:unnamed protein product [Cylindrotheca closterium]
MKSSPAKSTGSEASLQPPNIILRTSSKYHPLMICLLVGSTATVLFPLFFALRDGDFHTAWTLLWSVLFIGLVFMLVLPKTVDVRSDGVIGIKTMLTTWKFTDVTRAYESSFSPDELMMPRIKFATTWKPPHRVILCRKNGKWDVLVSPEDAKEFVEAVNNLVGSEEVVNAETGVKKTPKRDLSSQ